MGHYSCERARESHSPPPMTADHVLQLPLFTPTDTGAPPGKGEIPLSCAECRRSKLKCNRCANSCSLVKSVLSAVGQGFSVPVMHSSRMCCDLSGWYVSPAASFYV
ncbi:hypothetical protein FA95DRAFT_239017 [Auriscalpium vulgare]|uniref:Uncharacterized protein n=1 Tax=Auriscalpium vulgare TaxID=40419 RepID=A0ACB8S5D3_9AGAM|nr:hypothetical protein FA95DRAFT_239017 [Auriscalpium vulgare]